MKIESALFSFSFSVCFACLVPADETAASQSQIRAAVERSLTLLEKASAGTAENRTCFTCHGQALPVIAVVASKRRGFDIDVDNLNHQVVHTHSHLKRGRKAYTEGKGQGGGVDTAGYALWTLEDGGRKTDDVVTMVIDWLLTKQHDDGFWRRSSNRPPSEASNFTSTYLALRTLSHFGSKQQHQAIDQATELAIQWAQDSKPKDTEDQVFRLLSFHYGDVSDDVVDEAIHRLQREQRDDGGWSQKSDMDSDPYATATVMYALRETDAIKTDDDAWQQGLAFLLTQQRDDGSWFVKSRSKPFQKYFETGFPHGKDQFISTSATAWATIVLAQSLPAQNPVGPQQAADPSDETADE